MSALERAIARPQPVHGFGSRSPLDGLDRRSVGFADVLAQSVAAVAPSAAATTVVLLVAGVAGSAAVLAVAVAGVLALLIASTINQFAKRMATAGSIYTFVSKGLGSGAAVVAGAAIMIGYGFISVFALLGGAHYLTLLISALWPSFGGPLATTATLAGQAAVLAIVLVRGIRLSSRLALVVELVSVAIIVALFIALLVQIGPIDLSAIVALDDLSAAGLAAGAVLALTAFVGFESAATLGVEARSPLRNIPRAIVGTVLVSAVLYVLAAYTQIAGFAALGQSFAQSTSPVNDLADAFGAAQLGVLIDLGITGSFLACAIASTTALTRLLFSMGRDGVAPRAFGKVHARHRTPIVAIGVAVPLVTLGSVLAVLTGNSPWEAMQAVIAISATGYIVAYALVCIAAPVFLRRIGENTFASTLIAIVSTIALAGGLLIYLAYEGMRGNLGVTVALVVAAIAACLVAWRLRRGAASLAGIGTYDEPIAAHVLGGVNDAHRGRPPARDASDSSPGV
ncbi:APC family permease [Microbacterium sp. R86528]|uniref:APC family permease n=1 Tax=Microbacterium sp. R86528 TaxID=3093864 RepID=UPI0037CBEEAC